MNLALPIDYTYLQTLEIEVTRKLTENPKDPNFKFINSEIKKVRHNQNKVMDLILSMNTVSSKFNLEIYNEKIVLPLPDQEQKETRYLIGVRSEEVEYLRSSKKVENYYTLAQLENKADWKKVAEELCAALNRRGSDMPSIAPTEV